MLVYGYPDSSDWRAGHTSRPRHGQITNYMRRELLSRVHCKLEIEIDKAMRGVEYSIKSNVWQQIPDMAMSITRLIQDIPPPPGSDGEDRSAGNLDMDHSLLLSFEPDQWLEYPGFCGIESGLNSDDRFGFSILGNQQISDYSSHSSNLSNGFDAAAASSNTSFDDYGCTGEQFARQQTMALPEQFSLPLHDPNYAYHY